MTARHLAAEHHQSAAFHHQQAAQFHHEASRHFETGKDYAHAAHQALLAHGHALRAFDGENAAGKYYKEHAPEAALKPEQSELHFAPKSAEDAKAGQTMLSGAEHHAAAADHHEQAARHNAEAAQHLNENNHDLAAREAQLAHRHAHYSVFHDDEAAMHYTEHYGKSGQSAQLA